MRNYNIESDLKQEQFQTLKLVQGDRGNKIKINVYEDGQPVSLTGCSITAKYKRADGEIINDGVIENIHDNSFDAVMDSSITKVAGTLKLLFTIENDAVKGGAFLLLADVREGIGESSSSGGSAGGGEVTVDFSDYYKKIETYSRKEIDAQFKDIANYSLTKGTDGKVYIKKQDGTLIGEGIEVGSNADLSKITMRMNGQTLKLMNGEEQVASVDLPVGTGEIPDNTVLYEEDSESMGDVITAENITIKDTNNNFTSTHVEGALNELFQSASNGKTLIANAITGKGVKTNATDSFQTMATNIENISGGSGGITPTGTKEITQNGTYDVTNFATVLVNVTSSGGTLESGTITPTKQSTTLDIPTTKKCSNLVFFQHEMKPGVGYRMLTGLIRCGGVGINLASNSNGSTLNVIGTSGNTLECVVVTFNDNSIHISSNKDTGGGGYLVDKQYDWYAW